MLDNLVVAIYLIVALLIGIYYRSKSNSLHGYGSMASSSTNTFILVATIFATAVGGGTTFGLSEKAFSHNLSYSYALILTVPVDLLIAFYLVPKVTKHYGAVSVGDIMGKFYGNTGRVITGIAATLISVGYLAAQVNVSGRIFQSILGIDHIQGIFLSFTIVTIYTAVGGLRSVVFVSILQFIAMILAIPLVTFVGGYDLYTQGLIAAIPSAKYALEGDLVKETLAIALGFSVMGFYPSYIQKILINKNASTVKSAVVIKSVVYVLFIICVSINGLIAFVMDPTQTSALAIPYMLDQILPLGLKGFVVVGILSSVMSTADSDLSIASMSIVNDILKPLTDIQNEYTLLILAKVTTLVLGCFSIGLALIFHNAVDLVIFAAGFWGPMVLVQVVAGLFGIIGTQRTFITTSMVGTISFVLWEYYSPIAAFKGVFVGTAASLICFCIALCIERKLSARSKSVSGSYI
jgi:SSS family solute:Na+ symporter